MIPHTLHRIVLPPLRPAGRVERYWRGFQLHNPGWEFRTWSDPDPEVWPITGHLYPACNGPAQVSDLMRLEILYREGGVYVDTDCESVRPLAPLLDDPNGFFTGTEDGEHLGTGVMGASSGHPAVKAYLEAVDAGFDPTLHPNLSTGPALATRVLGGRADVTVHPPRLFYPEPESARDLLWAERKNASEYAAAGAYVVHRWARTWRQPSALGRAHLQTIKVRRAVRHALRL